jgi:hypothetical protein
VIARYRAITWQFSTRVLIAIAAKKGVATSPERKRDRLSLAAFARRAGQAEKPLTAREMMLALLDGKEPQATRKQELDSGGHSGDHAEAVGEVG